MLKSALPVSISVVDLFAGRYQTAPVKLVVPYWAGPDFIVARDGDSIGFYAPRYVNGVCRTFELIDVALTPCDKADILLRFTERSFLI